MLEEVILYKDADVKYLTDIKGWISSDGRYWGDNEHMARYCSCTHDICATEGCENTVNKSYRICAECADKRDQLKWEESEKREVSPYDNMYYSQRNDRYFQEWEDVEEYCEENELLPEDLLLYHCERETSPQLDIEILYEDITPEDLELSDMVNDEIECLVEKLNEALSRHPVNCFNPTNIGVQL